MRLVVSARSSGSLSRALIHDARSMSIAPAAEAAARRAAALSLASSLPNAAAVENYAITYGLNANASLVPSGPSRPLCVVKVGGEVVAKDSATLVASLRALLAQGLTPVVVHGGGPQLNDELAKAGVEPQYIGGHRVTDAPTMAVAKRVFEAANTHLCNALNAASLPCSPFLGGVFHAVVADAQLGLVGRITRLETAGVEAAIKQGRIPVLTSVGVRDDAVGGVLNINADVAARMLAIALHPLRVVFISAGGGWKEEGKVIDELDMANDFERMVNRDYNGRQGTLLKLNEMKAITDAVPGTTSVTICSAAALAQQLLPHQGPGTQIRRGVAVSHFGSLGAADATRVLAALRAGGASDSAIDALSEPASIDALYATAEYTAVAVVSKGSPPRLVALCASASAMAEGADSALWKRLKRDYTALSWEAIAPTPILAANDAIIKNGVTHIPKAFPALSTTRSAAYADGTVRLSSGASAMWWGPGGDAAAIGALIRGANYAPVMVRDPVSLEGLQKQNVAPSPPPPHSRSRSRSVRVGLLGARGFVGRELLKLIANHPSMTVVAASSRALKGQGVAQALGVPEASEACVAGLEFCDLTPEALARGDAPAVDAWVLALPNGLAAAHVAAIEASATKLKNPLPLLLDLSADYRFEDKKGSEWVYGLPERFGARGLLAKARRIANPGCYATGAQAALMPLLSSSSSLKWDLNFKPHVFGVSGYSGAGTTPSEKNDPNRLR